MIRSLDEAGGAPWKLIYPTSSPAELPSSTNGRTGLVAGEADHRNAPVCTSVEALAAGPAVELVYIASPNRLHAEHTLLAAAHGKHVLLDHQLARVQIQHQRHVQPAFAGGHFRVMSASHFWFGASAWKSRSSTLGATGWACLESVVTTRKRRRL